MKNLFILQTFLARQVSSKINYLDSECWQNKPIKGADIIANIGDFKISLDDFKSLDKDNAKKLGFSTWSDDNEDLMLIPAYLWRFIPQGLEIVDFNGEAVNYNTFEDLDNDERFGCLAYGLIIK